MSLGHPVRAYGVWHGENLRDLLGRSSIGAPCAPCARFCGQMYMCAYVYTGKSERERERKRAREKESERTRERERKMRERKRERCSIERERCSVVLCGVCHSLANTHVVEMYF